MIGSQPDDTTSKQPLPSCKTEGCTSLSKRSRRCSSCAFEYWAIKGAIKLCPLYKETRKHISYLRLGSISMSLLQIPCHLCPSTYEVSKDCSMSTKNQSQAIHVCMVYEPKKTTRIILWMLVALHFTKIQSPWMSLWSAKAYWAGLPS